MGHTSAEARRKEGPAGCEPSRGPPTFSKENAKVRKRRNAVKVEDKKKVSGDVHTPSVFQVSTEPDGIRQRVWRERGGWGGGAGTLTLRSLRSKAVCGPVLGCAPAGHRGGARRQWRPGWSRSRVESGAGDRAPGWSAARLAAALEMDPRVGSGAGTSRRTLRGGRGLPAHGGTPGSRPPATGRKRAWGWGLGVKEATPHPAHRPLCVRPVSLAFCKKGMWSHIPLYRQDN